MLILKEKVFDKKSLLALKFRIFLLDHLVSVFLFFVCLEFAPIVMTPWIVNRVKFSRIGQKRQTSSLEILKTAQMWNDLKSSDIV